MQNTLQIFQDNVKDFVLKCFGQKIADDKIERSYRFLEESLELVQASGISKDDVQRMIDYVYGRPIGEVSQEAGGVMITFAALCNAQGIKMDTVSQAALTEVWGKIEKIRTKFATKTLRVKES